MMDKHSTLDTKQERRTYIMSIKNFLEKQSIKRQIAQLNRKLQHKDHQAYALGIGFYSQPQGYREVDSEYNTIIRHQIAKLEDKLLAS